MLEESRSPTPTVAPMQLRKLAIPHANNHFFHLMVVSNRLLSAQLYLGLSAHPLLSLDLISAVFVVADKRAIGLQWSHSQLTNTHSSGSKLRIPGENSDSKSIRSDKITFHAFGCTAELSQLGPSRTSTGLVKGGCTPLSKEINGTV